MGASTGTTKRAAGSKNPRADASGNVPLMLFTKRTPVTARNTAAGRGQVGAELLPGDGRGVPTSLDKIEADENIASDLSEGRHQLDDSSVVNRRKICSRVMDTDSCLRRPQPCWIT